jgi:uncharacterized protein with ParB-like and HNH nuclease domain
MGLKAYDRKISQIFNNIEYDVDFYQREYKWTDDGNSTFKPVSSLLNDIFYRFDQEKYNPNQNISAENIDKLEWYYLNTYMTNEIKGRKYLVDGQQRLTTLTLVILSLYHQSILFKLEDHVINSLKNSILGTNEFGKNFWLGFKDRKDALEDIFKNDINFEGEPKNLSETNIYSNYKTISTILKNKFQTGHHLQTFIAYLRNRVYLIEIEITKDKDVAMVFEVINDRGIPLKPYEILKGKILSQIDIVDRFNFIQIWEENLKKIEAFGEGQIDEFFGYYFRSKFADNSETYKELEKTRYHKTIFTKDFENKIGLKDNEKNARHFVEKIIPYYTDIYVKMLMYYNEYQKEYEFIYFNSLNDMDGQFILTFSSIDFMDTNKDDKMKLIPKLFDQFFSIANLTKSYKSNEFNAEIISLNPIIRNQNMEFILSKFKEYLTRLVKNNHSRLTLDEPFKYEFFKNIGYNDLGKTFLRYFFSRIDHYISDCSDLNEYGTYHQLVTQTKGGDVYHIEHILSNNDENIQQFDDEEDFNLNRNRLGGLLLLKGKDNQSSGNELYASKLATYNVSGTYFARTLLQDMYSKKVTFLKFIKEKSLDFKAYPSAFGKEQIEERQLLLFNLSKLVWEV